MQPTVVARLLLAPAHLRASIALSQHVDVAWAHTAAARLAGAQGGASRRQEEKVLIVGAGPVGLTLALLLHKRGIPAVVIDRLAGESDHPKAHFINMRTMEVLREINPTLSAHVTSLAPPRDQWRNFLYCSSMLGPHMAVYDHFAGHTPESRASMSPEGVVHLAQPKLVSALLVEAHRRSIDVRFGYQFETSHQSSGNVQHVRVCNTATGEREVWTHRFVVGADGANSAVRRHLGIDMEGKEKTHDFIGVHFHCPSLLQHVVQRRLQTGMLFFIFNEHTMGVVVAHNMAEGNYVYQIPYFPPFQTLEDTFSSAQCRALVHQAIGADLDVSIQSVRAWRMTSKVASTYHRDGSILVGDAGHYFPPAGAFGMNTGVADAHGLAWRLAGVMQGVLSPDTFADYSSERRAVAQSNARRSIVNLNCVMNVMRSLGTDPDKAEMLAQSYRYPPLSLLPTSLQASSFNKALSIGRLPLAAISSQSKVGSMLASRAISLISQGQGLSLLFDGQDLGYAYPSACTLPGTAATSLACIPVPTQPTSPAHRLVDPTTAWPTSSPAARIAEPADPMAYVPTIAPGHRLPHMLAHTPAGSHPLQDLLPTTGRVHSALLLTDTPDHRQLLPALAKDPTIECLLFRTSLPSGASDPSVLAIDNPLLRPWACVLVRPDGHIAACSADSSVAKALSGQ